MDVIIGLLEIALWIIVVVSMAAALTWFMIRVMPQRSKDEDERAEIAEDAAES